MNLRVSRPAGIIVVDLVQHSQRPKAQSVAIQRVMSDTLNSGLRELGIEKIKLNHTGDGYLCALLDECSVRILDYLNLIVPRLVRDLEDHQQQFRIGVDFGILHLQKVALDDAEIHFDQPGIMAARLQSVASPGQILCSTTVFELFRPHYPIMFSTAVHRKAKDREIAAYEITPMVTFERALKEFMVKSIFNTDFSDSTGLPPGSRILFAEDYEDAREMYREYLEQMCELNVDAVTNGEQAIKLYEKDKYTLVILDLSLPGMDGWEATRAIKRMDPSQPVMALTGHALAQASEGFFRSGGDNFVTKPCLPNDLVRELGATVTRCNRKQAIRDLLPYLCDDPGALLASLERIGTSVRNILSLPGGITDDLALHLLRHKVRQLVREAVDRVPPGSDPVLRCAELKQQIECIERLCRVVGRANSEDLPASVSALIADYRQMHQNLVLDEAYSKVETVRKHRFSGIIVLIIAELIDNAIAATKQRGRVHCSLAVSLLLDYFRSLCGTMDLVCLRMSRGGCSTRGCRRKAADGGWACFW